MQPNDTRRRGVLLLLVLAVLVLAVVALGIASSRASASPAGDPSTEVALARVTAKVERLTKQLAELDRDVHVLYDELGRVDELTHAQACTVRIWEDGSARFLDPETEMSRACRGFIVTYVGSGQRAKDAR